jgi:hypothetical protein
VKVLYVLGRGRSGSTIFANVLGELGGYFSAGEVRYLFDPGLITGAQCGCGDPIEECPIWSKVIDHLGEINIDEVVSWQHDVVRERNTVRLLRYKSKGDWVAAEGYARVMARVYEALADVTGSDVIVDSSKRPSYAAFIRLLDGVNPYFVQLIRDPRASAYSWRHRRHLSAHGGGKEVTRRNALDSTLRWDVLNIGAEAVLRKAGPERSTSLRYEDFVASPPATVARIAEFVGHKPETSPFIDDRSLEMGPNHTLSGNPSRFTSGRLEIKDSREWAQEQSRLDRWLATSMALPFLHRYGYSLLPPK